MDKFVLAAGVIHPPFFPDENVRVQETHTVVQDGKKEIVSVTLRRIPLKDD